MQLCLFLKLYRTIWHHLAKPQTPVSYLLLWGSTPQNTRAQRPIGKHSHYDGSCGSERTEGSESNDLPAAIRKPKTHLYVTDKAKLNAHH